MIELFTFSDHASATSPYDPEPDMDCSPLARLPAEIRDVIYTLVLGDQDIHVRNAGSAVSYSICTESITHRERVVALKENDSDDLYFPEELDHYNCATHNVKPALTKLDLALLLVCRQIRREAGLLPFKTNTFVVSNVRQLQHFGNSLPESQRRAVSSVCLVTSYIDSLPWNARAGPAVLAFEGVLHLVVVVGVAHRTSMEEFKHFLQEVQESFNSCSLVSVDLLIRFRNSRKTVTELKLLQAEYAECARQTKQALVRTTENEGL